jgi:photosystem II stability/assembly factor-like uncharacterized protein
MRKVFILVVFILSAFLNAGSYGGSGDGVAGTTWTQRNSGTNYSLMYVAYGNNTFVAVGLNGTILTSQDGVNWTRRSLKIANRLYRIPNELRGVTYGNNTFVAVGRNGIILTSP